jgi:PIN domain nuclease of toxin-antitoxin system
VLDASALLAVLHDESGGAEVVPITAAAAMSAVNWSEVYQRMLAFGIDVAGARAEVEDLGVDIVPFDAEHAEAAGELWSEARGAGLSLADRACLALARRLGVPAVTADRAWGRLDLGVEIRVIR